MYLAFSITLFLFFATFIYAGISGATWMPTKKKDVERFLKLAKLKSDEVFYDIGCGNGRMVIVAAKQGAKAVGLEISLFPYLLGKLNIFLKQSSAKIKYRDLWRYNLGDADVIYFFLMPKKMKRLKTKFEQELNPGTRVISYVWPIDGWTPIKIDECEGWPKMYLYKMTKLF